MIIHLCFWDHVITHLWFWGPWATDLSSGSPIFIFFTSLTCRVEKPLHESCTTWTSNEQKELLVDIFNLTHHSGQKFIMDAALNKQATWSERLVHNVRREREREREREKDSSHQSAEFPGTVSTLHHKDKRTGCSQSSCVKRSERTHVHAVRFFGNICYGRGWE